MSSIAESPQNLLLGQHLKMIKTCVESGLLDKFLETLLNAMSIFFLLDWDFRRNIENFNGRYVFKSRDGSIVTSTIFADGIMEVLDYEIDDSDITITFKDGKTLMEFLFDRNPDVINSILNNEITYEGNLTYMFKFAYMAKHLQLLFEL